MKEYICSKCLHSGVPKKVKRGSSKMEWMLWLVLLIPGPFYSVWRMMGKKKRCVACDSDTLVSLDSAMGQRLQGIIEKELADVMKPVPKKPVDVPEKIVAAVGKTVDEVMRQQTGMSLDKGLGVTEKSQNNKAEEYHPRSPSTPQNPEEW